jgi:hypothetical protein
MTDLGRLVHILDDLIASDLMVVWGARLSSGGR